MKNTAQFCLFFLSLIIINACEKPGSVIVPVETSTVTDVEGNVYKTIKIGNQWWMAENLKAGKYRDSSTILHVPRYQNVTWDTIQSGASCIYDDDNVNAPGRLYNWYAVNDPRGIAPAGWHIPSDGEWKELEKYLGMGESEIDKVNWRGTHEGEKLKVSGVGGGAENWQQYSDVWSTNESGFSALAGNCRMFNGGWGFPAGLQSTGFWWSSTENSGNENEAWYRHLDYKKANVFRFYGPKTYGFSIRCVKDQ